MDEVMAQATVDPAADTGALQSGISRRDEIADAALICFERSGVAATRVEDVLGEAAIARSTFYRHFKNIDEVVLHLIARFTRELMNEAVAASLRGNTNVVEAVSEVVARMVVRDDDTRIVRLLGVAEIQHFSYRMVADPDAMEVLAGPLSHILADGQRSGEIRGDLPLETLVEWITRNIASIRFRLPTRPRTVEALKDYVMTFVMPALLPTPNPEMGNLDKRLSRMEALLQERLPPAKG